MTLLPLGSAFQEAAPPESVPEGLPFWLLWFLLCVILLLVVFIFLRDKDLRRKDQLVPFGGPPAHDPPAAPGQTPQG